MLLDHGTAIARWIVLLNGCRDGPGTRETREWCYASGNYSWGRPYHLEGRGEEQNTSRVGNSARCVPYSHSKGNSIRRSSINHMDAPSRIQQN